LANDNRNGGNGNGGGEDDDDDDPDEENEEGLVLGWRAITDTKLFTPYPLSAA
jgi:hypothetical protein